MAYDEQPTPGHEIQIAPTQPQKVYLGTLALSALLLITAGALEALPWPVSVLGLASLAATRVPGGRWFAVGGGVVFAGMVLVTQITGVGRTDYVQRAAGAGEAQTQAQEQTASESLGLALGSIVESWNGLDQPPSITGGLIRETEAGQYDSFRYRFDSAASLAGAFDPADDSVHALLASVGLFHDSAAHFYLHLCFMLHPYSQDCIDSYMEQGLGDRPLSDYIGAEHSTSWELGDQLWKLEITGDVQTIRILGPAVR